MRDVLLARWQGVLLTLVVGVATLWLAATGQLVLYIHPRYVVFTVVMTLIGVAASLAVLLWSPRGDDPDDHDHADETWPTEEPGRARRRRSRPGRTALRRSLLTAGTIVVTALAVAIVALPPATLTSATATTRDVNSSTAALEGTTVDEANAAGSSAYASFSVLDWAGLLRQTSDVAFYTGKQADVTGIVTASGDDPDVFYLTRFVVTCCAVDAQPVGVPVQLPDWRDELAVDQWVRVEGGFQTNRSAESSDPVALVPETIEQVDQPRDPYLY
ncbi:TIGR03943 family putative permease subunit [Frigoribacterium salinisoli]